MRALCKVNALSLSCSRAVLAEAASRRALQYSTQTGLHLRRARSSERRWRWKCERRIGYATLADSEPTRKLHQSLLRLSRLAPEYLDRSRLQLILHSLESNSPVLRIGLLGVGPDGFSKACRIARLLTASPLDPEEPYERALLSSLASGGKPLLLRFSADTPTAIQTSSSNSLVNTMDIPSPFLQRSSMEILVAPIATTEQGELRGRRSTDSSTSQQILDSALVPVVQSITAGSGRYEFVRFPVHKSVVIASGLDGLITARALRKHIQNWPEDLVNLVSLAVDVNIPRAVSQDTATLNIDEAEAGLEQFRKDVSTGPDYSEKWQSSGLSALASLIAPPASEQDLRSTVLKAQSLSILDSVQSSLEKTISTQTSLYQNQGVPEETRGRLQTAIGEWAEYAHTDLQQSLALAFESPTWKRTSFPRILWRADDITYASTEITYSNFLQQSQTYLAFLCGRIKEAGLATNDARLHPTQTANQPEKELASHAEDHRTTVPFAPSKTQLERLDQAGPDPGAPIAVTATPKPWLEAIDTARQDLLRTLVPALHARAQSLVMQCYGTAGGATALAAWYVAATAGQGLYEAGALASFGLVLALRRLQKAWGRARGGFEGEVREQGRLTLGQIEAVLRTNVRESRRHAVRAEERAAWEAAREAVERCREDARNFK